MHSEKLSSEGKQKNVRTLGRKIKHKCRRQEGGRGGSTRHGLSNKLTSFYHVSCIMCPVIGRDIRHNIVKVAVDPCGMHWPSGSVDYFDNVMTKFIVNNRPDA